eukprot:GGOE01056494.1.p2 GENE.GGOE01056494.1~~GGOE01056494.1.p2  ORF type:complete len:151 (-),score=10.62 GGOE01056494.1:77-529(-)
MKHKKNEHHHVQCMRRPRRIPSSLLQDSHNAMGASVQQPFSTPRVISRQTLLYGATPIIIVQWVHRCFVLFVNFVLGGGIYMLHNAMGSLAYDSFSIYCRVALALRTMTSYSLFLLALCPIFVIQRVGHHQSVVTCAALSVMLVVDLYAP